MRWAITPIRLGRDDTLLVFACCEAYIVCSAEPASEQPDGGCFQVFRYRGYEFSSTQRGIIGTQDTAQCKTGIKAIKEEGKIEDMHVTWEKR